MRGPHCDRHGFIIIIYDKMNYGRTFGIVVRRGLRMPGVLLEEYKLLSSRYPYQFNIMMTAQTFFGLMIYGRVWERQICRPTH